MTAVIENPTRSITTPMLAIHPEMAGKVAVITGAARGMGAVFARGLARQGVNIVAADINEADVLRTAADINTELGDNESAGKVVGTAVDVTNPDDHDAVLKHALDQFGRVDFWINNAGIFPQADILDITPEQINSTYQVNLNGVLFGAQTAARHMKENGGGAIINMASVAAVRVRVTRGAYNSSKAAVKHLTNCLAVELGPHNIRVNAVAPGFIDTEMTRWVHEQPGALDKALGSIPLRRIGAPEEVFGTLLFLLSDSARYVTGTTVAVDGGSQHI
ncbi:short-chain dehydrogenase [Arthrobacter sp. PAMC 25486]|uniref:SDR family NAD(P)-dependent oxidoreductase n=1 Tax=Arthrobacter sp. PAMC 25486 TaxID=1494608 RepID=UPI000535BD25|nr:SDR family oxidoreductase [Arthrobacter sp. PAMC 25486]AIY03058.1 short-chain dehydrogenase [Arthrobacter sp. PAMC 25486]